MFWLKIIMCLATAFGIILKVPLYTVLPVKSDSDVMFCLQNYQGFIIDRSLVY